MRIRSLKLLGIASLVLFAGVPASTTFANINVGTNQCQAFAEFGQVANVFNGTYNDSTSNGVIMVCHVLRSPIATTGGVAAFFVDGDGAGTSCVFASYEYTGALLGTVTVTSSTATYDLYASLTQAQAPYYAYIYLYCVVPPGGTLRGVTAIDN